MASKTQNAFASAQTRMGLGIETTRGTKATATYWLPVKAPKYKPDLTIIDDETLQGTMIQVYDQVPGMRYDAHGWDSYPYLDTFGALVRCELGSADTKTAAPTSTTLSTAAVAGATKVKTAASIASGSWIVIGSGATMETHLTKGVSGTYTITLASPLLYSQAKTATVTGLTKHEFSLLNNTAAKGNQPPSATLFDYDGERCRQLTAAQLDDLTIKGNATGFVTYTCSWFANAATKVTAPTPSFSTAEAPPGWTFTASIDGTQIGYMETWEYALKRGVKPIPALTGTQEYYEYFAGPIQTTGKMKFVEHATSPQLTEFEAGTIGVFDLAFYDTRSGYACNLHSTRAAFKAASLDRSKEWVEVDLTVQLLPSATDATSGGRSPIKVTVANAKTTTY